MAFPIPINYFNFRPGSNLFFDFSTKFKKIEKRFFFPRYYVHFQNYYLPLCWFVSSEFFYQTHGQYWWRSDLYFVFVPNFVKCIKMAIELKFLSVYFSNIDCGHCSRVVDRFEWWIVWLWMGNESMITDVKFIQPKFSSRSMALWHWAFSSIKYVLRRILIVSAQSTWSILTRDR